MQVSPVDVRKFELEVELSNGAKREYEYRKKDGRASAKVKMRDNEGRKAKQDDQVGLEAAERLLSELSPSPGMPEDELLQRAREALQLGDDAIRKLEVEVEFADGSEIEAESSK